MFTFGGDDRGFTLVELLTVIMLTTILLGLGAAGLRRYWFVQSLYSAQDEVAAQLRELQERSVGATDPVTYGAWFELETSSYGVVEYDVVLDSCESTETRSLGSGVVVRTAAFAENASGVDMADAVAACQLEVPDADDFVFFLARGTATAGSVSVAQPVVDRPAEGIEVRGLTGRVNKL